MLRQLELTKEMHKTLIAFCESRHIEFFSTGFDIESLNYLASLGTECFKIPSGEITNLPYLRIVGAFGKSVILSTGMSTLGEIGPHSMNWKKQVLNGPKSLYYIVILNIPHLCMMLICAPCVLFIMP